LRTILYKTELFQHYTGQQVILLLKLRRLSTEVKKVSIRVCFTYQTSILDYQTIYLDYRSV